MLGTKTWLNFHGLDLAMHKMELLLITGRHIPLHEDSTIGNEVFKTKSLEIWRDAFLRCTDAIGSQIF